MATPEGKTRISNKQRTDTAFTVVVDRREDDVVSLTSITEEPCSTQPSDRATITESSSQGSSKLTRRSNLTFGEDVLNEDTLVIATYVKEEMYYGVKFLYDPKHDLAVGGMIFNHFYRKCRKKLEGFKRYQEQKEIYIRYLWKQAIDERIQQDSLSTKRSSVYTVMQNRFFCKCAT